MKRTLDHVYTELKKHFGPALLKSSRSGFELSVTFDPDDVVDAIAYMRDHKDMEFKQLTDLCGVDHLGKTPRYEVVYHLLSYKHNFRIRVKTKIDEEGAVPTLCNVYSAANWFEREAFDMFGIKFDGHPDLRRLLTDYDFEGYPLRKDFPLSGFVEPRYDAEQQRVVYNPVKLPQEYRNFDSLSPWEGMTPELQVKLPGDEKANEQLDQKSEAS